MKVTLDLGQLLQEKKITQPEYDRLLALASAIGLKFVNTRMKTAG